MPPPTDTAATLAAIWLDGLERALDRSGPAALADLFLFDSHWRDVLALGWDIRTVSGGPAIAAAVTDSRRTSAPTGFRIAPGRTPPRHVKRAGRSCIEALIAFETKLGRCNGVIRLVVDLDVTDQVKAWTLLTALDELKDHEETTGARRPDGQSFCRDFHGPNWLDRRTRTAAFEDRDPAVLVVGAGQAGLSIAARLIQLQVDTLVIDREERIGDTWRHRYHALTLHNQVHVNHFAYMPFPASWPTYIPKDKLAGWMQAYAESMEINTWTGTELQHARYDDAGQLWDVELRRKDGSRRRLRPRHIVMATGASCIPSIPEIPSLAAFKGEVVHSSGYRDSAQWSGRRALVIGTGTSGHDIAQDLHAAGAMVTIAQRSPTLVVNIEPSAQLVYSLYEEGPPLEDCDLITTAFPLALLRRFHQICTAQGRELDRELHERLQRRGFRLDFGEDDTGWQFKYLSRGGGYYFNVGCSDLIADGAIGLIQYSDIATFVGDGARLREGDEIKADLIVLATGYKGQQHQVRQLFGDDVADRVGPIWGFGDDQELRNMFSRTPQPGLWFMAGSFAQCRIYSKYLALQIKGREAGLVS